MLGEARGVADPTTLVLTIGVVDYKRPLARGIATPRPLRRG